jgi:DNA-binding NtrC family response regulator
MRNATCLVVDHDGSIRQSLAEKLRADGYDVVEAPTGQAALEHVADGVDLVLVAGDPPDLEGAAALRQITQRDPDALVILLLNARATADAAVEAMRAGAFHAAHGPIHLDEISLRVAKALETARLRRELRMLRTRRALPCGFDDIVGGSAVMTGIRDLLRTIAGGPASTVLLTGERGTGKHLAARVLHGNSQRANRPFVDVACAEIPAAVLDSELFGHEPGAFPEARRRRRGLFEQADGGTVFLDEVGEIVPALQPKLLRFVEEKTFRRVGGEHDIRVDVRVIAAASRQLDDQVRAGRFRQDLYYRLNVMPIGLPPLRSHLEDVPALVAHYIDHFNREFRKSVQGTTADAARGLQAHEWPGNVREVRNVVERAVLVADGPWLEPRDFPSVAARGQGARAIPLPADGVDLEQLEKSLVEQALERSGHNQTRAALLLGLNRDQIRYRIEKFQLARPAAHGHRARQASAV